MIRCLLCCLWPRSQREGRSAKQIQDDLRGCLAERRRVVETVAEAVRVRDDFKSMLRDLTVDFERRVGRVKLDPRLCRLPREETLKRWWAGELFQLSGPTPLFVTCALREARRCLIVRREKLQEVDKRIRSLRKELAEAAVEGENVELDFSLEQLDAEVFLPSEPLTTIAQVRDSTAPVSVQPNFVNWEARLDAACRKFLTSSDRVRQDLRQFDQLFTESMRLHEERAKKTQHPKLHLACEKVAPDVHLSGESLGMLAPVEYATASVCVVAPLEHATVSVAETVDQPHGSEQKAGDWDAKLDADLDTAHQRLQLSCADASQAVKQPDQTWTEPVREKCWDYVAHKPPQVPHHQRKRRFKTWYQVLPELHVADKQLTSSVLLPELSQEEIVLVENATASTKSVTTPVSATADYGSASKLKAIDWDAKLNAALDAARQRLLGSSACNCQVMKEPDPLITAAGEPLPSDRNSVPGATVSSLSVTTPVLRSAAADRGRASKLKSIDWDAKLNAALDAARQRLLGTSAHGGQAVKEPDQLIELPQENLCLQVKTQLEMPVSMSVADQQVTSDVHLLELSQEAIVPVENATASLSVTDQQVTSGVLLPELSQEAIVLVENATASVSVAAPAENATELISVSAAADHGSGSNRKPIDWHARLDAARQKSQASRLWVRQSLEQFDWKLRV